MSNFGRNLALWVIIALLLVVLFNLFQPGTGRSADQQIAYSDFIGEINAGRVKDVTIQEEGEWKRFLIRPDGNTDLREDVFRLAADRKWRVRELSQRGATLEDVFVEMTHTDA